MEKKEYPWYMQFDQSIILDFQLPKGIENTINKLQIIMTKEMILLTRIYWVI